jgi:A/G-specific adenine glycosylase
MNPKISVKCFRARVYGYYRAHRRAMPWRDTTEPYRILVSEVMLQQTQVSRVLDKYAQFIRAFPTVRSLAEADLSRILAVWQGLGYNRRALLLRKLAAEVVADYGGRIPGDRESLRALPGIGDATAGSICAFAFDQPVAFIETNIRSVFIHHFFKPGDTVSDRQILPLVERYLDAKHPREWYYALMDYGAHLKSVMPNPSRTSKHYVRQSRFEGSDRQIRGRLLRALLRASPLSLRQLCAEAGADKGRYHTIVERLCSEGLITKRGGLCSIA